MKKISIHILITFQLLLSFVVLSSEAHKTANKINGTTNSSQEDSTVKNDTKQKVNGSTEMTGAPSLLWVISARSATIKKVKNQYLLTLHNVYPKVLYFSDRPRRFAGHITSSRFLQQWKHIEFKKSAPNGTFVHADMDSKNQMSQQPFAFEISNPVRKAKATWQFQLDTLKGDSIKAGNFPDISIFIDSSNVALTDNFEQIW